MKNFQYIEYIKFIGFRKLKEKNIQIYPRTIKMHIIGEVDAFEEDDQENVDEMEKFDIYIREFKAKYSNFL